MVNVAKVGELLGELTLLKYFPADKMARAALVRIVCEMADSDAQVEWLVHRMLNLYAEWPGIREVRACYCSKFKPRDGINAYSEVYPDGIPAERRPAPQLTAGERKMIEAPADAPITDPKVAKAVQRLTASMPKMPSGRPVGGQFEKALREVCTAPQDRAELPAPTPQVITREDCEAEVRKLREAKEKQAV